MSAVNFGYFLLHFTGEQECRFQDEHRPLANSQLSCAKSLRVWWTGNARFQTVKPPTT